MAKTIDELKSAAAIVRDASEEHENTALRVGQLLVDMIDLLGLGITPFLVNNLTQGGSTKALTAEQGKVLKELIDSKAFPIINDLITGGISSALSAEQGKVLKQIVDRLSEINIDGIKGFVPISSLNDLPASPTSDQKGMAYILDNALYIYVGNSGDTLDGKYQSTPLVTLDWNDKAYAPSIYNGLGRTTLKKNMVEGVNVLTSAMVSITNTEYFIQYDYDLGGAEVTLPANASLVFMGGSIKNGTLIGNNTRIQAKKGVFIFDNITIQGTWDVAEAYSSWFKMHKKGYKIKDVTEAAITLYKGTDNNYYDFEDLTLVGSSYYVTSTLVSGEVVESSIKVTATTYATFRVEGYNADSSINYVAAPPSIPGAFDGSDYAQYDDTKSLQSLLDLRAKRTIVEEGVYIIKADTNYNNSRYNGLYIDNHKDSELVLEGWLKVYPNNRTGCFALDVIGCDNFKISGKGGIHGDLLEHTGTGGEGGMNLAVAGTRNFTVESITTAYAWGDCIYSHWWTNGRVGTIRDNTMQEYHTYKNVKVIYGGRTGYGCERANNVVFDGCYFYGTGRVRGKATNSAVDIEPFNYADTPQRYVMNYEFKNNVFENSANGIRLERCVNCSVHNNYFDFGWSGIAVIWHTDVSYDITSPNDIGWLKSRMSIYDNFIRRCTRGIFLGYGTFGIENISIYNNTLVSCNSPIVSNDNTIVTNCDIYGNTTYGCGRWGFHALADSTIHDNRSYGCKMPLLSDTWGSGSIIDIGVANSSGSSFYHNSFSLDYGKPIKGLNADGKEELYHGLPVGFRYAAASGCTLTEPSKVHFYENHISDDFYVLYSASYDYQNNARFEGGINTLRDENSEVFIKGDTFRSSIYGDEGIVEKGGMISCSWLKTEEEGGIVREFEPYMAVAYGEIIKVGDYYRICRKGGKCGETYNSGDAEFLSNDATGYVPNTASASIINISFKTRGVCTSDNRPTSFLYAGRKMLETDTGRDIVYNGTSWVYENYIPKIEVSGTAVTQVLAPNTFYEFSEALTALNVSLVSHDSIAFFAGRFSTDSGGCNLTPASPIILESGAPTIEGGKTYEFNIIDNIMMLKEI